VVLDRIAATTMRAAIGVSRAIQQEGSVEEQLERSGQGQHGFIAPPEHEAATPQRAKLRRARAAGAYHFSIHAPVGQASNDAPPAAIRYG
jgi:hypothetical protein